MDSPHATRFLTDSSLEQLARRLRVLGHDVEVLRGARLEELFDQAERDGRTLLTLSGRHPRRWTSVDVVRVPRGDEAAGLRAAVARGAAPGPPFSRCSRCNGPLAWRSAFEAHGEVPGRVVRSGRPLRSCTSCGHWYWLGSHAVRLTEWLESALGERLEFEGRDLMDVDRPAGTSGAPAPPVR